MKLIVGATGMLGGEICRLLAAQGTAVRALVRETSNSEKVTRLRALGAEVVRGDLKDRASLEAACRGASVVVSTASSTVVVQHVPEEALRAQHDAATDPLQQSFAALMLYYAHGDAIDMADTLRALPVQHLKSVHAYLQATA